MAKNIDVSSLLGNNKKAICSAAVGTVTPALFKECGLSTGDTVVLTKLPANVLVTGAYLVVTEPMAGTSLKATINGAAVDLDVSTVCATHQDSVAAFVTSAPVEIKAVLTIGAGLKRGEAHLVIEFTELNGYMGTFLG